MWSLVKDIGMELITMDGFVVQTYSTTTLARLTLIILFFEMFKISNLFSNFFWKRTIESSRIYYLSKLEF
jgi:hypothetical protein